MRIFKLILTTFLLCYTFSGFGQPIFPPQVVNPTLMASWRTSGLNFPDPAKPLTQVKCINVLELLLLNDINFRNDGAITFTTMDFQTILNSAKQEYDDILNASPNLSTDNTFIEVFFPEGIYNITGDPSAGGNMTSVNLPLKVAIRGAGARVTELRWTGRLVDEQLILVGDASNDSNDSPEADKNENSGIKCLTIDGSFISNNVERPVAQNDFTLSLNSDIKTALDRLMFDKTLVKFKNATNAWMINCKTFMGFGAHIDFVHRNQNVTIQGNFMESNWIHGLHEGEGVKSFLHGYGIHFSGKEKNVDPEAPLLKDRLPFSFNCLIENNIIRDTRHGIVVQSGATENVISYNYVFDSWSYKDQSGKGEKYLLTQPKFEMDISIHGMFPASNLFEGNVVDYLVVDTYRVTSSSPDSDNLSQVFYRNRIRKRFWVHGAVAPLKYCGTVKNVGQVIIANFAKKYDVSSTGHFILQNATFNLSFPSDLDHCWGDNNFNNTRQFGSNAMLGQSCYLTSNTTTDWIPSSYTFPLIGMNNGTIRNNWRNHAHTRYHTGILFDGGLITDCIECEIDVENLNDNGVTIDPMIVQYDPQGCTQQYSQGQYMTSKTINTTGITGGIAPSSVVSFSAGSGANFSVNNSTGSSVVISATSTSGYPMLAGPLHMMATDADGTTATTTFIVMCGGFGRATNSLPSEFINSASTRSNVIENRMSEATIFPNPTSANATLAYTVSNDSKVNIKLMNSLGQMIRVLKAENQTTGEYQVTIERENLPSGVYFCHIQIGEFTKAIKLIIK